MLRASSVHLVVSIQYQLVTDRWMERQMDAQPQHIPRYDSAAQ